MFANANQHQVDGIYNAKVWQLKLVLIEFAKVKYIYIYKSGFRDIMASYRNGKGLPQWY